MFASAFEIEPTQWSEVSRPRLLLPELACFTGSRPNRPVWMITRAWKVMQYGGFRVNGSDLPVMAVASFDYLVSEYRRPAYHIVWRDFVQRQLKLDLRLDHIVAGPRTDEIDVFDRGTLECTGVFYDKSWMDAAAAVTDPWFPILRDFGFHVDDRQAAAHLGLADYFANGEIGQGNSGYQEVVIITPTGAPRAFTVPEKVDR